MTTSAAKKNIVTCPLKMFARSDAIHFIFFCSKLGVKVVRYHRWEFMKEKSKTFKLALFLGWKRGRDLGFFLFS